MNLFALAGISCAVSCVVLAAMTVFFGKTKLHRILFFFNTVVALWGMGLFMVGIAGSELVAIKGWKVAHIGGFFIGPLFYHLVCVITGQERKKLLSLAYAQAVIFNIFNLGTDLLIYKTRNSFGLYYNDVSPLLFIAILFYLFYILLSYIELSKFIKRTKGYKRTQTLYVIFGFLIGFVGGTSTFLPEFRIDVVYPFGNFGITLYCFIVSYAILRYRLMDIKLVFRKSMVYSLSAGILTSIFVLTILTMTRFLSDMAGINSFRITAIAAFIIAILFNPLRNSIQRLVDKKFYKRTYDYYSTIQQVSSTLSSIFNKNNIFRFVGNVVYEVLGLESVYVLSSIPAEGTYEVVYQINKDGGKLESVTEDSKRLNIKESSLVIEVFSKSKDIVIKDEFPLLAEKFGSNVVEDFRVEIEKFDGAVMVPVFVDGKLSYLLVLGDKLSGDMFTAEDVNLLSTIAEQTATALKNAQFYGNKVQTERLASIGMMSATFAHEIRNPLTSLKTFAQLMPEKYNDHEFRDTFSKIVVGEIEKIDTLIGDLLDFSTEKKSARVNEFNIVELVDESLEYIKGKFDHEKKNIDVIKLYHENNIHMLGDDTKLKQAFGIIITNGYQSMNGSGKLTVSINKTDAGVDVAVSDTGEGIPHEDISKIFDPFITTKEMGVGLGLAITKRVIEDHDGKIHVRSRVAEGTTFTISLPVKI